MDGEDAAGGGAGGGDADRTDAGLPAQPAAAQAARSGVVNAAADDGEPGAPGGEQAPDPQTDAAVPGTGGTEVDVAGVGADGGDPALAAPAGGDADLGTAGDAGAGGGAPAEHGAVSGEEDAADASDAGEQSPGDTDAEVPLDRTRTPNFYTEFRHTLGARGGTEAEAEPVPVQVQTAEDGSAGGGTPGRGELEHTGLSIDVGDADLSGEQGTGHSQEAASPEAAERERLMTALEHEALEEEREARETEAQILAFADSASPASTAPPAAPAFAEASVPGTTTMLSSFLLRGVGAVETVAAWLPADGCDPAALLAGPGASAADESLADASVIEDEILQAAMRWVSVGMASVGVAGPRAQRPSTRHSQDPQPGVTQRLVDVPADGEQEEDARAPEFVTQYAYSPEDEAAAQEVLEQLHHLLASPPGAEAAALDGADRSQEEGGAGRATGGVADTRASTAHAAAEGLLQEQPARVRHAVAASLSRDGTGVQVVEWLRGRAAVVLQLAYRCHRSRRMLATHAARRHGNAEIDFDRMARRLIEDLETEDATEELADMISHAVSVLAQLPDELAQQVRRVVRESPAPLAATIRSRAAIAVRSRAPRLLQCLFLSPATRLCCARSCVHTRRMCRHKLGGLPQWAAVEAGVLTAARARALARTQLRVVVPQGTRNTTRGPRLPDTRTCRVWRCDCWHPRCALRPGAQCGQGRGSCCRRRRGHGPRVG